MASKQIILAITGILLFLVGIIVGVYLVQPIQQGRKIQSIQEPSSVNNMSSSTNFSQTQATTTAQIFVPPAADSSYQKAAEEAGNFLIEERKTFTEETKKALTECNNKNMDLVEVEVLPTYLGKTLNGPLYRYASPLSFRYYFRGSCGLNIQVNPDLSFSTSSTTGDNRQPISLSDWKIGAEKVIQTGDVLDSNTGNLGRCSDLSLQQQSSTLIWTLSLDYAYVCDLYRKIQMNATTGKIISDQTYPYSGPLFQ